jgi:osmotically-inducible protein OsmY
MKPILIAACAALAFAAVPAAAQQKPKETTVVIKDDTTPKVKKGTQVVSDASVTTAVKTRLMKDKAARETSIDVDTKAGVVTIAGVVPTQADKTRIESLVRHTTGVKGVKDDLTVSAIATSGHEPKKDETKIVVKDDTTPAMKKAGNAVTDTSITTAVKTRLMTDEVARGTSIDVNTEKGVVTIAGSVPTAADKERIGQLVAKTTGVTRVVNNLTTR